MIAVPNTGSWFWLKKQRTSFNWTVWEGRTDPGISEPWNLKMLLPLEVMISSKQMVKMYPSEEVMLEKLGQLRIVTAGPPLDDCAWTAG